MQLDRGEKAVLAYFNNQQKAFAAAAQLRTLGYREVEVDSLARTPRMERIPSGMTGMHTYTGLSYIDEFNNMAGPEVARLGSNLNDQANYPQDMADGQRYVVTVVTESSNATKAREVLRSMGALN
ncbi:MAG: hypothetical protein ACM3NT_06515 [Methylocystaceae bacterium]